MRYIEDRKKSTNQVWYTDQQLFQVCKLDLCRHQGTASALHINSCIVFSLALSPDDEHQIPFLIQNWPNSWLSREKDQMWERSNQHQAKEMRNIHSSVLGWIGKSELSEQHEAYIQLSKQFYFLSFSGNGSCLQRIYTAKPQVCWFLTSVL